MIETIIAKEKTGFEWLDITDPTEDDFAYIKGKYSLNEASIQDSREPEHLPKIEEFDNYVFIILRVLSDDYQEESDNIGEVTDRLTIFYGKDFVITLHKRKNSHLDQIKKWTFGDQKTKDSRHLAVLLTTAALSKFNKIIVPLSNRIDTYEEIVFLKKNRQEPILKNLYFVKRQIDVARKVIFLYKDIVEHFHSTSKKDVYTRDLKDLQLRTATLYDNLSENITQLLNIYFNISSNHTNEIMRVLTIFSVFFMPITFLAGIYGMNFHNMPELEWYYGYPLSIAVMAVVCLAIYWWFKRKGWL